MDQMVEQHCHPLSLVAASMAKNKAQNNPHTCEVVLNQVWVILLDK